MTCLVIVIQATNSTLLLIFNDLLSEDFKLKLHKVDLLLQVNDILISLVHVRVVTQLPWSQLLLLLATEVHSHG